MCHDLRGFPNDSLVKNPLANAGDTSSIPESGGSPGEGNGNPLQYSCLGKPMDRGAWQATVHGVTKESDTTELLNNSKTLLVISPTVEKIKQVSEKGNFSDGVGNFSGG